VIRAALTGFGRGSVAWPTVFGGEAGLQLWAIRLLGVGHFGESSPSELVVRTVERPADVQPFGQISQSTGNALFSETGRRGDEGACENSTRP
jgi:hypothetical protein